ncbi:MULTISPECIES: carboxymuconolactone decarboxylase family protein [Burkholderia]|nr:MULTISPECIES: carboxymuconolactone decarboxylase family protein [Burkholderia]MBR8393075.1 carboxymuconolactone decarboxylase family protein [Burkholderia cenocepacia]MBR8470813.1 carboxymuconolactone decarboxylase family protein [Burkholderia cenocepacia]MBR8489713.1 carboxymuconolactone decarboxylase family protein [Burkholderia cenocepacia]MBY4799007.1 carboxymuconolactone decarboxylase family protein [Burkholderia cepacia]MDO5922930.1 carboxymuconolactone decarboxylase family protein [B
MNTFDRKPSSQRLVEANPDAMSHYRKMRGQLFPPENVDEATCEIMLAMQLAVLGREIPFKVHALRALSRGVTKVQLEGLLLCGMGVSLVAFEAAQALIWLDEACAEADTPQPAQT